MTRVLDLIPRSHLSVPVAPVAVPKAANTQLLADTTKSIDTSEIAILQIQNVGQNGMYYNCGAECDNVGNFCGYLAPGGGAANIFTRQAVNGYAPDGATTIAILKIKRDEHVQNASPFVK